MPACGEGPAAQVPGEQGVADGRISKQVGKHGIGLRHQRLRKNALRLKHQHPRKNTLELRRQRLRKNALRLSH
jgi:hypothetical protein